MSTTSADAIRFHYDISNEFYRLWLDRAMVYSCALWSRGEQTLEEAQAEKMRHHADAAGAQEGARILDVGCGWGSQLRMMIEERRVSYALGLTLSPAQKQWFDEGAHLPQAEVLLAGWEEFQDRTPYHGIISVGAFEHFGRVDQDPAERLEVYRRFFDFCRRHLLRGGAISLQTIAYGRLRGMSQFTREAIWPESELPTASEILQAAHPWFEVEEMLNHRMHYVRTLLAWRDRLRAQTDAATAVVGAERVGNFLRYMEMSALAFEQAGLQLLRIRLRQVGMSAN